MKSLVNDLRKLASHPALDKAITQDAALGVGVFAAALIDARSLAFSAVAGAIVAGLKAAGRAALTQVRSWAQSSSTTKAS